MIENSCQQHVNTLNPHTEVLNHVFLLSSSYAMHAGTFRRCGEGCLSCGMAVTDLPICVKASKAVILLIENINKSRLDVNIISS